MKDEWTERIEKLETEKAELLKACKMALSVLSVSYENGKGEVDMEAALHAFGTLRAVIKNAQKEVKPNENRIQN